jgi:ribonuclease BN (tRNA processing enzyme)
MIVAGGKRILVDPGRSSFTQLMSQGFHPSSLAAVIATHSHWDCCRDLKPVVMAACPVIKENWRDTDDYPRLYADRSVLYGLEMDADGVIESSGDYGYFEKQDKERLARYKASLKDFHYSVPGVLTAYDLHFRLGGRFEQIEINHEYKISTNVDLYTRPSFHPIGHAVESIPALDFVVHQNGKPQARCVYLSDTEYRKELADIYAQDLEKLGPVDVLICNVKTLNVFEKPADDPYEGYTWKHLGWKGLLQLTKDFRERKILVPESLVVLRAWGLETVTNLDKLDKALIAAPEKLSVYEEEYKDQIDQNAVIPDITWVHVKDRQRPISIDHIRPPFRKREIYRRFGKVFYGSPAMEKVVQSAKAVTDDRNVTVLITGESGSGKDELAKGIHDEAVYTGKRSGKLIIRNAASLDTNLAEAILFGARKGAYTGLDEDMDGWLKEAEDGTLLIQEVAICRSIPKRNC